jgi:NAD-dependent SIR2 family protein deacetylase
MLGLEMPDGSTLACCHRQAFFAQIYSEAQASRAATGHHAMAQLQQLGALQRHYTLNIDGLSEARRDEGL